MIAPQAEGAALVWCPFADADSAAQVATQLLDEGLVACANVLPEMRSLYVWNGRRESAREVAVLFKTDAALLARASARLTELHPYEAPAVVGWRADVAAPATLAWLAGLVEPAR